MKPYKRQKGPEEERSASHGKPEMSKLSSRPVAAAQPTNGADASVLRTPAPLIGALGSTRKGGEAPCSEN